MTFQAYLGNIKAKTGKTSDNFRVLAAEKGVNQIQRNPYLAAAGL